MKKSKFIKRYDEKDQQVQEYMSFISDTIIEKYGNIPEQFVLSLDMLANNLEIMVRSTKEMDDTGLTDDDKYHGKKKSAALQTYFQAQGYINGIIANFGLTPGGASRIKENKKEVDINSFLEQLTA